VLGERGKIHDIIANLLTNAMKYSPRDTAIGIAVGRHAGICRISVADEGPGISRSDIGDLFKRFKRLANLPTDGESSTGLGLWITKRLVELHGGAIELESRSPRGSVFVVELPAARAVIDAQSERGAT
jgi:signal transduction histidine kinase